MKEKDYNKLELVDVVAYFFTAALMLFGIPLVIAVVAAVFSSMILSIIFSVEVTNSKLPGMIAIFYASSFFAILVWAVKEHIKHSKNLKENQ